MNNSDDLEAEILFLWFDPSLHRFIPEILARDDIPVTSVRAASDAFELLARDHRRYIVLMDNYHVSEDAYAFARTLFARPDLHRPVRLIGLAAWPPGVTMSWPPRRVSRAPILLRRPHRRHRARPRQPHQRRLSMPHEPPSAVGRAESGLVLRVWSAPPSGSSPNALEAGGASKRSGSQHMVRRRRTTARASCAHHG